MSTENVLYSASEVCKIIKACSLNSVSSITLPSIEISFGEKLQVDQPELIIHPSVENPPQGSQLERQAEVQSIIAEQEADTMHLVDPEQWEKSELMEMDADEAKR